MRSLSVLMVIWMTVQTALANPADGAREAIKLLDAATQKLEAAESSRDRVRALTATISAYEAGLGALRNSLRLVAMRQSELSSDLQARDAEIAALLAVLQRVGGTRSPVVLLHPAGPAGTVRAGMLVADLTPSLNAKAEALRQDLSEMEDLQEMQRNAVARLETGLQEIQAARAALNMAIANRTNLPKQFTADPVNEAILVASAQTLEEFASGLDLLISEDLASDSFDLSVTKGTLPSPVAGRMIRRAGEPDAAGVVRPGIILETEPQAVVTSPAPATIRYIGPLLDLGQVVILEPQSDLLIVLAGFGTVYGSAGEIIEADAPLGLMGDGSKKSETYLSTDGDETGTALTETLYIEVRENNKPVDPTLWFRENMDG